MASTVLAAVDRAINKWSCTLHYIFFPFRFSFRSVGEKRMTHFRSLLASARLVVSLVSVASHISGIQWKHSEADLGA